MENQPWQKETSAPPHFPLLVPLSLKNQEGKKKTKKKAQQNAERFDEMRFTNRRKWSARGLRKPQNSHCSPRSGNKQQCAPESQRHRGDSAQGRRQRDKEDEALAFCQRGRGRGRGLNTHQNRRPVPVMIDTRNVFQPTPIHIPRRNSTRLRNASARYLVVSITTTSNGRQCKLTLSDGRRDCSLFMPVWDDG